MAAKKSTKSKAPEKKIFTDSEYSVKRIYQKSNKKKSSEDAGKYPFTRGIHPGMFRERFLINSFYRIFRIGKNFLFRSL